MSFWPSETDTAIRRATFKDAVEWRAFTLGARHATAGVPHPGYCRTAAASRAAMRALAGRVLNLPGDANEHATDVVADAYERGRISTLPTLDDRETNR